MPNRDDHDDFNKHDGDGDEKDESDDGTDDGDDDEYAGDDDLPQVVVVMVATMMSRR